MSKASLSDARELVMSSAKILVLTGAGISTDSVIPDFRGPDGLWTKNPGAEEASDIRVFISDKLARTAFWKMLLMVMGNDPPQPNAGHEALAQLETLGKLRLLATQNIDGLRQAAGVSADLIVEVHGGWQDTKCLQCGNIRAISETVLRVKSGEEDPSCLACGGMLKANVVLFGEELPDGAIDRVYQAAQDCDLMICVGSTLSVYPVAGAVPIALQSGSKLIIVNRGATEFDKHADYLLDGSISELLPMLVSSKL